MSGDIAVFAAAAGDENILAGRMYSHRRPGVESTSFVYDGRFLASPDGFALDPALPLVTGLLEVAEFFRLDASSALEVLGEVTQATASWRDVATSHGLAQRDLDDMEPAFEHAEAEQARALTKG